MFLIFCKIFTKPNRLPGMGLLINIVPNYFNTEIKKSQQKLLTFLKISSKILTVVKEEVKFSPLPKKEKG